MTLPCSREAAVALTGVGTDDRAHGAGRMEIVYSQEEVFPQEASALGWNTSPLWPTSSMSSHSFPTEPLIIRTWDSDALFKVQTNPEVKHQNTQRFVVGRRAGGQAGRGTISQALSSIGNRRLQSSLLPVFLFWGGPQ